MSDCLDQVRYRLDRQDAEGEALLADIKSVGNAVIGEYPAEVRMEINQIIYETKIPLKFDVPMGEDRADVSGVKRISPKLPELLEVIRRESVFKTAFDLYDLLLPHIQQLEVKTQLAMVAELAMSKRSLAHETAILMLLHPDKEVRIKIPKILDALADKKLFTPIDLRRLITLRNWVPEEERSAIDVLILTLKHNKLKTAPYLASGVKHVMATMIDGAGAGVIVFETKAKHRSAGGVLFKIGVGIKDAWVIQKVSKDYLEGLMGQVTENGSKFKPSTLSYMNPIVRHFLYEALRSGQVPSARLLEIAELLGEASWNPNPLNWEEMVQKLVESVSDCTSDQLIKRALAEGRSAWDKAIGQCWFEVGSVAEQALIEAKTLYDKNASQPLSVLLAKSLMARCLEKWKLIFLITALRAQASKKDEAYLEILGILEALRAGIEPEKITIFVKIAKQSSMSIMERYEAMGV